MYPAGVTPALAPAPDLTPEEEAAAVRARTVQLSNGAEWLAGSSGGTTHDPVKREQVRQLLAKIEGPLGERYRTGK